METTIQETLLYMLKRELSTDELREVVEDLELTIEARENIPF
jgi:hypothetical protein